MRKRLSWTLTVLAVAVLLRADGQAVAINVADCSLAAVQAAITAAVDGDTIALPSCPGGTSWTTPLIITKALTIQGAGIGNTVLIDDVPKGNSSCAGASPVLRMDVAAPKRWRITGVTIRGRAPDTYVCNSGHVVVQNTSKAWRIDNVRIENQQTSGIRVYGDTWGVVDHSQFQGSRKQGLVVEHGNWGGKTYGDGSWAEPPYWGTEKAVYIEDCTFTDDNPVGAGAVDSLSGGRIVFRYNKAAFLGTHGTESGGRRRSIRTFEIYNNTFDAGALAIYTAINLRGGTGVIYNNTFTGAYTSMVNVQNFRDTAAYNPWGQCNGSSPYDQNLSGQSGYACLDQIGRSTGNLISGDTPTPAAWPNQTLEPLYQWGNTKNGAANPVISSGAAHILAGRDYYDNQVKPGYTAYSYPHPLTLSDSSSPPPPPPPSTKFVVGDRVIAQLDVLARSTPSLSGTILQLHLAGELGKVVGGPEYADGYTWWQIDYDTGFDGWSTEPQLEKFTATPRAPSGLRIVQ